MFFLTLLLFAALVRAASQVESMAKFENAFGIIRKVNFQIDEDDLQFCGTYSSRCLARRGYAIKKLYYLHADSSSEAMLMDIRILFYQNSDCSEDSKLMNMDMKYAVSIVSRKYHRIELTISNVFMQFYKNVMNDYKCNVNISLRKPYSIKSLICGTSETRDIFKTIRNTISRTYPASAFFTSYMFDVTDSSGSQIKLHQISRDNCVSRVVAMSNEKEQSKKDAKTGDGTKADNMLSVRMAEYAEEKKQLSALNKDRTEKKEPTKQPKSTKAKEQTIDDESADIDEPFSAEGIAVAIHEAGQTFPKEALNDMNYHYQYIRRMNMQKEKKVMYQEETNDLLGRLLRFTRVSVQEKTQSRWRLQLVASCLMIVVVFYLVRVVK